MALWGWLMVAAGAVALIVAFGAPLLVPEEYARNIPWRSMPVTFWLLVLGGGGLVVWPLFNAFFR